MCLCVCAVFCVYVQLSKIINKLESIIHHNNNIKFLENFTCSYYNHTVSQLHSSILYIVIAITVTQLSSLCIRNQLISLKQRYQGCIQYKLCRLLQHNQCKKFTFCYIVRQIVMTLLCNINVTVKFCLFFVYTCSNKTDERLPVIVSCREPFMEALNEIEDIN